MITRLRIGYGLVPLTLLSAGALGVSTAWAAVTATTPVQVPDHPWAGTSAACDQVIANSEKAGSTNYPGSEVEPYASANPTDQKHLIGAWQQDRWNDGGNNGEVTVTSSNGGKTWALSSSQPKFTICAGATPGSPSYYQRSSDPWISYSADGRTAYQASLAFDANGPAFGGPSSVQVSTSSDNGQTWNTPSAIRQDNSTTVLNDKEAVTADSTRPSNAYVVWDRLVSPSTSANPGAYAHTPAYRGPSWFSMTTDDGKTWSPSKIIYDPGQNDQTIDNQVVVPSAGTAKGTLFDFFVQILNSGGKGNPGTTYNVAVIKSTDGGATWSGPTIISPLTDAPVSIGSHAVRTGDIVPSFTTDPANGNLYAAWQDGSFTPDGHAKIAFSQSSDGGQHWSAPIRIDQSPGDTQAFTPQVHVNGNGTIGVSYYDFQNATAAQPGLTDEYLVTCSSNCASAGSWASGGETRLSTTGSFDMTTAPDAGGYFTGDYEGLTSTGSTFDPLWMMAKPIATKGDTDPFASNAG